MSLVYPPAPWEATRRRDVVLCSGCQGTGKIIGLDQKIRPCDLCVDQRAIDAAAIARMRLEGRDPTDYAKRLSETKLQPITLNEVPMTMTSPVLPSARILEMSSAKYHTDPIDPAIPSLSNSIASTIVIDAAYLGYLAHPRLGNVPTPPTKSMELGVLRHAATLEEGRGIAALPFDNWRTNASKDARSDARANGLVPMLLRDYEPLMALGQDIRAELADIGMKLRGKSEVVVTWHEQSKKFGPVLCRAMMDHLIVNEDSIEIIDLKFISSADIKTCVRHIYDFGYDCQHACYVSAIERLYPHLAGRIRFRFAFCQVMSARSPRRVLLTPIELNGEFQALGRERWQRGVETWARCLNTDQWPGYVPDGHIERVGPAPWMLTGEMDQQRAAANEEDEEDEDEDEAAA